MLTIEELRKLKENKTSHSDLYFELFNRRYSEDIARKYLQGILHYLESLDINSFYKSEEDNEIDYEDLINENDKLRKSLQGTRDKLRILRAEKRKEHREENKIDSLVKDLTELVKNRNEFVNDYGFKEVDIKEGTAILQLSDLHFNKVVNLEHNKFNFEVANKRLEILFNKVITELNMRKCNNIIIAFTGDLFNLDERDEQKKTNEFTRAEALLKGYDIICNYVNLLLFKGFNVSMVSVVGNESRLLTSIPQGNVDDLVKNNFDYVVFQMLKRNYQDIVAFLNNGDKLYDFFRVDDLHIGLMHSDKIKHNNLNKEVYQLRDMFKEKHNTYIDLFIFGHIHSHLSAKNFIRSSSLVGSDTYSFNELRIPDNDISQNLIYVKDNKVIVNRVDCYDK